MRGRITNCDMTLHGPIRVIADDWLSVGRVTVTKSKLHDGQTDGKRVLH